MRNFITCPKPASRERVCFKAYSNKMFLKDVGASGERGSTVFKYGHTEFDVGKISKWIKPAGRWKY